MFVGDKFDRLDSQLTELIARSQFTESARVCSRVPCADLKHLTVFEQNLRHDVTSRGAVLPRQWAPEQLGHG